MSDDDLLLSEDQFAEWLAACDAALATGKAPPSPAEIELPPEVRERMERGLEGLRLLDHLRMTRLESSNSKRPKIKNESAEAVNDQGRTVAPLPWTHLGRFQLIRELGRGGFGVVYLANDPVLDRAVALKVPHWTAAVSPPMRERFLREARAASGLDHPNIVLVHEAGEIGPVCYLVAAYCPGPTLAEWLTPMVAALCIGTSNLRTSCWRPIRNPKSQIGLVWNPASGLRICARRSPTSVSPSFWIRETIRQRSAE
jgi:Protein kinase domain